MARRRAMGRGILPGAALVLALHGLAGCDVIAALGVDGQTGSSGSATRLIERDVEAPEVFDVAENGLWDGRPSLGGVWAAHPAAQEPERVIIRNTRNGKFVIGALFRRAPEIPGTRLQVSSDAASALRMVAGESVKLQVTALRRENAAPVAPPPPMPGAPAPGISPPAASLPPVQQQQGAPAKASPLDRPYIQIGIFSQEDNARRAAGQMRNDGMVPTVRRQEAGGKTFWRVIVGPAQDTNERGALLAQINAAGFSDAYAVRD